MVLTTKAILAFRALNKSIDKNWIDWATSMLEQGYDTPHLRMLAGEANPYLSSQFEMRELVDKTLEELGFSWFDIDHVVKEYTAELLQDMLNGKRTSTAVLHELYDLCVELDYADYLYVFHSLYFAQNDLESYGEQHYFPANCSNIENVMQDEARKWLEEHVNQSD